MTDSKKRSLTRLDNNIEINLRYPDINDFLKDTSFSLQDNQIAEKSRVTNVQVSHSPTKDSRPVIINGIMTTMHLANITFLAFSENQELFYDFKLIPSLYDVQLPEIKADRVNVEALIQSTAAYVPTSSNQATNFNITISSFRLSQFLSSVFNDPVYLTPILKALNQETTNNPFAAIKEIFNSLSIRFSAFYGTSAAGSNYTFAFDTYVSFAYLNTTPITASPFTLPTIAAAPFNLTDSTAKLQFNATYNTKGNVKFARLKNQQFTQIDSITTAITDVTKPVSATTSLGASEYEWDTISGLGIGRPTYVYGYSFTPQNSSAVTADVFTAFTSPQSTVNNAVLTLEKYQTNFHTYRDLIALPTPDNPDRFFYLVQFVCFLTASSDEIKKFYKSGQIESSNYFAKNLRIKVEWFELSNDSSNLVVDSGSQRMLMYGSHYNAQTARPPRDPSVVPKSAFRTAYTQTRSKSLISSFAYVDFNSNNFLKLAHRISPLQSNYLIIDRNVRLFNTYIKISQLGADSTRIEILGQIDLNSKNDAQQFYFLTTASHIQISLLDPFFNEITKTGKVPTGNFLTMSESPFISTNNVLQPFYISTNPAIKTLAKSEIRPLLTDSVLDVAESLYIIESPTLILKRNTYANYSTFYDKVYCVAYFTKKINNELIVSWSKLKYKCNGSEFFADQDSFDALIPTSNTWILSDEAKNKIATWFGFQNESYTLYFVLPFKFLRTFTIDNTVNHLVSVSLSQQMSGYRYQYIWKVNK